MSDAGRHISWRIGDAVDGRARNVIAKICRRREGRCDGTHIRCNRGAAGYSYDHYRRSHTDAAINPGRSDSGYRALNVTVRRFRSSFDRSCYVRYLPRNFFNT
jgi:hypothetical protein